MGLVLKDGMVVVVIEADQTDSTSISWLGRPETPFILPRGANKSAPGPAVSVSCIQPDTSVWWWTAKDESDSAEPRQATHVGVSEQPQLSCCKPDTPPETPSTARATQTCK